MPMRALPSLIRVSGGTAITFGPVEAVTVCLTPVMGDGDEERDRKADEREAALDHREKALDDRLAKAEEIAAAADQRDAVSDARDVRSDSRDDAIDRALSSESGFSYNPNAPGRRAASLDRQHAKDDRSASEEDRDALMEGPDDPEVP